MSEGSTGPGASEQTAQGGSYRTVLRNRSFRNLLLASVTSSMGDWIGFFALIALAETLEGATRAGALVVSGVMIARILPTLLIAPVAGVFVDRWDRKRTMVVTDIVRGGIMFLVPFVGNASQLLIATLSIEIASSLFVPAKDAVVPKVVAKRDLVQANQLSLMSSYATLPLGALLCAVVIAATQTIAGESTWIHGRPEAVPILLNALSFFASIVFINRMEVPTDHLEQRAAHARGETKGTIAELRDGLAFIAGMPLIRSLVVGIMAAFFAAGAVIGVGTFFATITNAGDAGFAMLGFIVGSGLVVGFVLAGPLSMRMDKEWLFAPGIGVAGLMLVVAALMPTLPAASLPAAIMGLGAGLAFVVGYTMLQENSRDELRGRMFAMVNSAVRLALFASLVLGPLVISVIGIEQTAEAIASGADVGTDLDALAIVEGTYPYQIGGVRLTLILAGFVALLGAVVTGRSIHRVLGERRTRAPGLQDLAPAGVEGIHRGALIVFEGGEGAGKSTQVRLLRAAVERAGLEAVVTREPGGTELGEAIRTLLLDPAGDVAPRAEALLYSAARAQHTAEVLLPAIERGAVVICDRFVDSSIVYQGVARGLGAEVITELNRWATQGLAPDLVILLDIDAASGLRRARTVDVPDRLEAEGVQFHARVNEGFRRLAAMHPERYLVVDATEPAEEAAARIREAVNELLAEVLAPETVAAAAAATAAAEQRAGVVAAPVEEPAVPGPDGTVELPAPVEEPASPAALEEPGPAVVDEEPAPPAAVEELASPVVVEEPAPAHVAEARPSWLELPEALTPLVPAEVDVTAVGQDVPAATEDRRA